jgi:hypothetical protein
LSHWRQGQDFFLESKKEDFAQLDMLANPGNVPAF